MVVPDGTTGTPGTQTSANIGAAGPGIYRSRAVPSPSGMMTGLLYAARDGNLEMTRVLMDLKAEIDKPAANGTTALIDAIVNNHIELALYLLEKGPIQMQPTILQRTPCLRQSKRAIRIRTRLRPPVPDAKDPLDLIKAILAKGAATNTRANTMPVRGFMQVSANWANFDGQTPFLRAALAGDITVMRLLLEHGADPNINTNDGATPLMAAAGVNWVVAQTFSHSDAEFIEAAKLCIEKGNDVNAVNSQGFTAVIGAANRGFDAMIKLLVEHGAKLDVKDKQGRSPMTFAEGVFLAVNPPVNRPATIALLKQLMGDGASDPKKDMKR
jgi:ankyrin repeat protein